MKKVGYKEGDDYEVLMDGLNNCPDYNEENGWCPHFVFDNELITKQSLMIASIPVSWYGLEKDIDWD